MYKQQLTLLLSFFSLSLTAPPLAVSSRAPPALASLSLVLPPTTLPLADAMSAVAVDPVAPCTCMLGWRTAVAGDWEKISEGVPALVLVLSESDWS